MLHQPEDNHPERHAQRRDHESDEAEKNGPEREAQPMGRSPTARPGADPRIARRAAEANFEDEEGEAKGEQNDGEKGRLGTVEAGPVFRVDFGGEGPEAQEREGPELDQHVESDEQHPSKQRGTQTRQNRAPETRPGPATERPRGLFESRVHVPQRRRDRQIDQRIVRRRDDQERAGEILQARAQRHPGIAGDERGHGERGDDQHRPYPLSRDAARSST